MREPEKKRESAPDGLTEAHANGFGTFCGDEFFRVLLMNANVWIAFIDEERHVTTWNHAAEKISGYTGGEVIGEKGIWAKLYPDPAYRKEVTGKIEKIISNRHSLERFETRIVCKDGSTRIISWNTSEIRDSGGKVKGYFIIGIDISEITRLETCFKVLLMNASVLVVFLDENRRIKVWNRFAEEVTGYTAEDVFRRNGIWTKLYPDPEYRKEIVEKIRGSITDPDGKETFETTIITKSGQEKLILWKTRMIHDRERNLDGYVIIGLDITKEVEMESEIFRYIGNSAMRLKFPVEIIRDNLTDLREKMISGEIDNEDAALQLSVEITHAEQILNNLYDINQAVQRSFNRMPEDMKNFLREIRR